MPDFSYNDSIAPYASSLFKRVESNPFLNSARKASISGSLLDSLERSKASRDKGEERSLDLELNRSRLDASRLALEDARTEAQLKRDAIERSPAVSSEFETILDSGLTNDEKRKALSKSAIRNADAISRSPSLSAKFGFAMKALPEEKEAFTPYQAASLDNADRTFKHTLDKEAKAKTEKELKEQEEKLNKERSWLENSTDIEFEDDDSDPSKIVKRFKQPNHRNKLLDVFLKYKPDEYEIASRITNPVELFEKASNIRQQALLSLEQTKSGKTEPETRIPIYLRKQ